MKRENSKGNSDVRVLLIEDNPGDALLIRELLRGDQGINFSMHHAEHLEAGLMMMDSDPFDVLLLDLSLPDSQGLETITRAREHAPQTPIVIITGQDDETFSLTSLSQGAQDYLVKGKVDGDMLRRTIRHAIERKRAEQLIMLANERLNYLLSSTTAVIYAAKSSGDYGATFISENVKAITGFESDEFLADSSFWFNHVHPEDQPRLDQEKLHVFEQQSYGYEYRFKTKAGNYSWIRDEMRLIQDEKGNPLEIIGYWKDITESKRAEDALRKSEEKLTKAQHVAHVGSWTWHIQENRFEWSDEMYYIFGIDKEGFTGDINEVIARAIHPDDRAEVERANLSVINKKEPVPLEYRVILPDGTVRTVWAEAGELILDEAGNSLNISGIVQDITERKRGEAERQALLEIMQGLTTTKGLQEFLQMIHHSVAKVIYAENLFVVFHHKDTGLFEEVYAVDKHDLPMPPSILENSITAYVFRTAQPLLLTQASFNGLVERVEEVKLIGTDSASWLGAPLRTPTEIIGVIAVQNYEDANCYSEGDKDFLASVGVQVALAIERRRTEVEIQQRNEDLALTNAINAAVNRGESLQAIIKLISEETIRIFKSQGATLYLLNESRDRLVMQNLALPPKMVAQVEKLIGMTIPTIELDIHEAYPFRQVLESKQGCLLTEPAQIQESIAAYIQTTHFSEKVRLRLRKLLPGLPKILGIRSQMVVPLISEGEVIGMLDVGSRSMFTQEDLRRLETIAGQLTIAINRKRAEEALHSSEDRYRDLVEGSSELICTHDLDGQILSTNPAGARFLGYEPSEVIQMNIRDILVPEARKGFESYIALLKRNGIASGLMFVQTRTGEKRIWEYNNTLRTEGVPKPVVRGLARDVTERKVAEEKLAASETELRALFAAMLDAVIVYDQEGRYVKIAPTNPSNLFRPLEEMLGKTVHEILPLEQADFIVAQINQTLRIGQVGQCEYALQIGGKEVWFSANVSPLSENTVIWVAHDITNRKRAEKEILRRMTDLELLYEGSLALGRLLSPQEIGRQLIAILTEHLTWQHAVIRIRRGESDALEVIGYSAPGVSQENYAAELQRLNSIISRVGEGMTGWVIQHGQPAYSDDLPSDPRYIETYPALRSGLYAPMKAGDEVIGAIGVESESADAFDEYDERLLTTIAAQAASALQNASLFEETRRRLAELEAVNRLSTALRTAQNLEEMLPRLLDETLAVFDTDTGSIWLYDPATGTLPQAVAHGWCARIQEHPVKPGEGIVGTVFASGHPYVSREIAIDPNTQEIINEQIPQGWGGACIPIRTAQETVGVMYVSVQLPRLISPEDARLLTTLAEIAGITIHRMRLNEQTERRLQRLTALHTIDQTISGAFDLPLTLDTILKAAVEQLGVDASLVLLYNPLFNTLEYANGYGFRSGAITQLRLRFGESHAGRAALEGRMVSIPDIRLAEQPLAQPELFAGEDFISFFAIPLIAKGKVKGVLQVFHRAPLEPSAERLDFLETLAGQAAIAIESNQLFDNIQRSHFELAIAYDATIEGWSRALDLRDKETEGHTQRVTELTLRLARLMGISDQDLVQVRRGAILHDIGKMGVPDNILLKPGPLTPEEWEIMRQHPVSAHKILSSIAYLRPALDIPHHHHEKWDGTGYPEGLAGERIPLAARIFAVVDVYDALVSDRPYRKAWTKDAAIQHIREQAGIHFDPKVVDGFMNLMAQIE